jgi:hypothetical protein
MMQDYIGHKLIGIKDEETDLWRKFLQDEGVLDYRFGPFVGQYTAKESTDAYGSVTQLTLMGMVFALRNPEVAKRLTATSFEELNGITYEEWYELWKDNKNWKNGKFHYPETCE